MYIVKSSTTNVEGQGHVVFYLDMDPITTGKADVMPSPAPKGAKIYVADKAADIASSSVSNGAFYTFTKVADGDHKFSAQLVQNDGTPFSPPLVYKTVLVTTKVPAPATTAAAK